VNTGHKASKLQEIQELEFALVDLSLFLDTHPQDQAAINDFLAIRDKWEAALKQYEESYGPLTATSHAAASKNWLWAEGPWPWEE